MMPTNQERAFRMLQEAFDYVARQPVAGRCEALRLIVEAQRKVFLSSFVQTPERL